MATSIQAVHNRFQSFNDLDLLVVLHLMIRKAEALCEGQPGQLEVVNHWRRVCETYGPGTIDLQLDAVVLDRSLKQFLLRVLSEIETELDVSGEVYAARLIKDGWRTPGVAVSDYNTALLRSTTKNLRTLVEQPA
jgi:hypothetical protein